MASSKTIQKQEWQSLWPDLFRQACLLAKLDDEEASPARGALAASVVLSQGAVECFASEYIVWRSLENRSEFHDWDAKSFMAKILTLNELQVIQDPSRISTVPMSSLRLMVRIRNSITHFDPTNLAMMSAISDIGRELTNAGVINSYLAGQPWQRQLLSTRVAQWACCVAGVAIMALEEHSIGRVRAPEAVTHVVTSAMSLLETKWTANSLR
jgi:hypothetical protein